MKRGIFRGLLVLLGCLASGVQAAVFTVGPGDSAGLQRALTKASSNDEADVIELATDSTYAIDKTQSMAGRLIINGNGATISTAADEFAGLAVAAGAVVTLRDLRLHDLRARAIAALYNAGTLRLVGSTLTGSYGEYCGRVACQIGWALQNIHSGTVELVNATVTNNGKALTGAGELSMVNTTISGNSIGLGGVGQFTASSSIVAGNDTDCNLDNLISLGHNIDSDGSCGFDQPTDLPNADPRLGDFGDHGGPVPTVSLRTDSPAVDAGDPERCSFLDARGLVRARGPDWNCDIGAFEHDGRARAIDAALTATWFDVHEDGHFFNVQVLGGGREQVLVHWNTFDAEGNALWLQGVGGIQGHRVDLVLYEYGGMRYPSFDPAERTYEPWGTLTLAYPSCWRAVAVYEPLDASLPPADSRLIRLTNTAGLSCH